MYTNKEKAVAVISYYWGSADNEIAKNRPELRECLQEAAIVAAERVLLELGLTLPDAQEFKSFLDEMDEITNILNKEFDLERIRKGTS